MARNVSGRLTFVGGWPRRGAHSYCAPFSAGSGENGGSRRSGGWWPVAVHGGRRRSPSRAGLTSARSPTPALATRTAPATLATGSHFAAKIAISIPRTTVDENRNPGRCRGSLHKRVYIINVSRSWPDCLPDLVYIMNVSRSWPDCLPVLVYITAIGRTNAGIKERPTSQ